MCYYNIFLIILLLNLGNFLVSAGFSVFPKPTFELLQPNGIRVTFPDVSGLQYVLFRGNVNKTIPASDRGDLLSFEFIKKDGKWFFEDKQIRLQTGDVIHYHFGVQIDGAVHLSPVQTWTVKFEKIKDVTEINNFPTIGKLLFNETFDTLNTSVWTREIKIPTTPDHEFCVYHNQHHENLAKIEDGKLRIKPQLLEDLYGENVTGFGTLILSTCTSIIPEECSRKAVNFNILPPVLSARFTTKDSFSFQYGKIEIRTKFPEGDWLYPEMWLQPKYENYGNGYESGCVVLGLARGNEDLSDIETGKIYDSKRLECGIKVGPVGNVKEHVISKVKENGPAWTKDFHVYTTIWSSDGFKFMVDDEEIGRLNPEANSWMNKTNFGKMAPFDKKFYITIGLGVGGIRVFPDGTISSGQKKPWRNVSAKAMLQFWKARRRWLPSWRRETGEKNVFEVDYIRVWSLEKN